MAAQFNELGVKCVSATLVESAEVSKSMEVKVIKNSDSSFAQAHRFDPSFTFSVKGRGPATGAVLGGAAAAYIPDQISGGISIITSLKLSETNEDYNSYEVSGVNYPSATDGSGD